MSTSAAAPMHPAQAAASSAISMAPMNIGGSTAPLCWRPGCCQRHRSYNYYSSNRHPFSHQYALDAPRGKASIAQPVDRLNLHVVAMSSLPRSVLDALSDPNSHTAMQAEYDALLTNDTWSLVPLPPGVNVVTGKWIYQHKLLTYGSLDRYKAH